MKKEDFILLAKRKEKGQNTYNYLYLDKNVNVAMAISNSAFHVCEKIEIIDKDIIYTTEDFEYHNLNTALLAFYFNDLEEIIDNDTLNILFKYYLETYENTYTGRDLEELKDQVYNKENEIKIIWRLIEKWYNRDNQDKKL